MKYRQIKGKIVSKLQEAISTIRAGDKVQGKKLLIEVLHAEPKNETAWLWMSAVVADINQRQECLEEVLKINPNNQSAQKGLASVQRRLDEEAQKAFSPQISQASTPSTTATANVWDKQPAPKNTPEETQLPKKEKELLRYRELILHELSNGSSPRVLSAKYIKKGFPKEAVEKLIYELDRELKPSNDSMPLAQLLFSTEGRIPRSTFWLYYLASMVIMIPLEFIFVFQLKMEENLEMMVFYFILGMVLNIPFVFVAIKRCHDRDRSGWFLLLQFIPIVNLWVSIELWFLAGTHGENQYGPDPRLHNRQRSLKSPQIDAIPPTS